MPFLDKKINSKAFTLIEILIYTAIFGVVAAGIIGVAWNITRLHTTQIASNEIDENLRYVMNLVNSKVREATMIEQATGTTLILRMPDSSKSPTTFSLTNGTLYIQEGSADPVAITSNRVEVTSLNFEYISVAGSKGGVRINITMAYKEQPGIASREYLTTVTKVNAIVFDSDIVPDTTNLRSVGTESYQWKNGFFSGSVGVGGDVSSTGFIIGGAGLCMGSDCRTSWGQVTGVTGSGTQNYIAKWTSSGSIGNSQIFDNGTSVGIGTTSPSYKLQVVGDIGLSSTSSIYFSTKERISANGSGEIGIDYNSGSTATNNFVVYNGSTAALFTVQRAGNIGIGTASPPSLLSVGASSQFQVNSSGDIVKIKNLTYSWPSSHSVGFLKNDGSGNLTWDTSGAVGGTGSAGQVAFWSSTTTITGDSGFYWDNTNKRLGLGTTAPGQRLSVVGDIGLSGGERFIGTTDAYGLSIRTNNTNRIFISADGNVGIGTTSPSRTLDVHGIAQLRGAPGGTGLFVDSGGNVGIGTTSPTEKLQIQTGGILFPSTNSMSVSPELFTAWQAPSSGGWARGIGWVGSGSIIGMIGAYGSGTSLNYLYFGGGTNVYLNPWMVINSSGNVGIGTTSPSVKLHVYESDTAKSGALINIATTSSSYYSLNVQSGGTSRLYVRADGNVGIGTTSPENSENWGRVLDVYGVSHSKIQASSSGGVNMRIMAHDSGIYSAPAGGILGTSSNHPISFITNAATRMIINTSGNVGIGTTSPSVKLHVYESDTAKSGALINIATTSSSYYSLNVQSGGTSRLYVRADGNVGIGTTSPEARLTVAGEDNSILVGCTSSNCWTNANGIIGFYGSGQHHAQIAFYPVNNAIAFIESSLSSPAYDQGSLDTIFNNGGTLPSLTNIYARNILSSGNIGIGTTSPGKKLDVYGGEIRVTSDDTTGALVINRVSNPDQALYLRGGAGSGEGRVASQYSLELKAGLGGGGAYNLTLSTAAGEAMRILGSNNNIGIGTANPGYKLEVAGSFKSSSGGGNLIQDTSGNVIIEL